MISLRSGYKHMLHTSCSSMPSPIYQWRKARRLYIAVNWRKTVSWNLLDAMNVCTWVRFLLNSSWMQVEFAKAVPAYEDPFSLWQVLYEYPCLCLADRRDRTQGNRHIVRDPSVLHMSRKNQQSDADSLYEIMRIFALEILHAFLLRALEAMYMST